MGLNDDVDDGLPPEETADFDPNLPVPDPIVIQVDDSLEDKNTEVTEEDLFGTGVIKNEVPNLNAQFVLTVEQCNKTMDLIDVRNTIARSNGICREDAELIDSNVPGFIGNKRPLGFFTEDKSRTQFSESLNSLDKTIDSNLGIITQQAKDSATATSTKMLPLIKELPNKVLEVTAELQNEISKLIAVVDFKGIHAGFTFADGSNLRDVLYQSWSMRYDDGENIKHCDPDVQAAMKDVAKFVMDRSSYNNLKCIFLPLLVPDVDKSIFSIGTSYSFYEVTDKAPYLATLDDEFLRKTHITLSVYEIMTCAVDAGTLESIKRLLGACSNIIGDIGTTVEEISSIAAEESNDYSSKLNRVVTINGANTKNTLFVVSVIAYIEEYIAFLGKLKALLTVFSNKLK